MLWWRRHPFGDEDLSTYVDGRPAPARARRLEAHLETCASCRERVEGLRLTVRALRDLPTEEAPRSFALRPEQAAATRMAKPRSRPQALRYAPALSAAALALFVALLTADLTTLGGGSDETGAVFELQSGDTSMAADRAGEEPVTPEADVEAPAIGLSDAQTPPEAPDEGAPPSEPAAVEPDGDGDSRWGLRAVEAAAGVAFLAGAALWLRRRRAMNRL